MLKAKNIAIISPNTLLNIGIQSLLVDFFTPYKVAVYTNATDFFMENLHPDFIFLTSDIYIARYDNFQPLKNRLVILADSSLHNNGGHSVITTLDVTRPLAELVEILQKFFEQRIQKNVSGENEDLSNREIEVLKNVAIGQLNKEIADTLNISLHTVITHRKNITRKLGIKTVSGLTVYAILNGLISTSDLE